MVCWKIHYLVRWCSYWTQNESGGFPIASHLNDDTGGAGNSRPATQKKWRSAPGIAWGSPSVCGAQRLRRSQKLRIDQKHGFCPLNWPIICCVFKLLLLISFLIQYYCFYVYYYCFLFIVTTIYCYWYHYHYHYYCYYVIITLFLLSLYMKIYTYDVTM